MSNFHDKETEKIDLLHSKGFAIGVIAFISIVFVCIMIGYGMSHIETETIDIVRTLPEGGSKIALTQDLAKEHMVIFLNNQKAFKPFIYGFIGLIVIIMGSLIYFDVRKIIIEQRESADAEDGNGSAFNNIQTFFLIGKVVMLCVILFSLYGVFKRIDNNTKNPESQTPTIKTVTVINKDIEIEYEDNDKKTYYYLIFDNGARRRVSQSNYEYVQIDHTYYMGLTEQDYIFGFYDTDIYELQ